MDMTSSPEANCIYDAWTSIKEFELKTRDPSTEQREFLEHSTVDDVLSEIQQVEQKHARSSHS